MRKIAHALIALLLLSSPAFAQKTKTQMTTEINTNFPDNTTGLITPALLRTTTIDMLNSWQQYAGVNAQTGTTYTVLVGDYGQLITFSNGSAVAVTLPQATGSFATFNVYVRNKGAGTVTITPTTSTVNGAATLVLTTGQAAWIVSDGTNYQTWLSGDSVTGPASSTNGDIAIFSGTTGKIIADAGGSIPSNPLVHPSSGNLVCSQGHVAWWVDQNLCSTADTWIINTTDPSALLSIPLGGANPTTGAGNITLTFTFGAGACVAGCNATFAQTAGMTLTQVAAGLVAAIQANASLYNNVAGAQGQILYVTNTSGTVHLDFDSRVSMIVTRTIGGTSSVTATVPVACAAACSKVWDATFQLGISKIVTGLAPPPGSTMFDLVVTGGTSGTPNTPAVQYGHIVMTVLNSTDGAISSQWALVTPDINGNINQGVYVGAGVYTVGAPDEGIDTITAAGAVSSINWAGVTTPTTGRGVSILGGGGNNIIVARNWNAATYEALLFQGSSFQFRPDNSATTGITISANLLRPDLDSATELGDSSHHWSTVWANNLVATAGITGVNYIISNVATFTNIAAPSSPAAAHVAVYSDLTDLRFHDKNAAGVIGTTVVADTGASNNYISAISAAGVITKSRPTCSTLSDAGAACSVVLGTGVATALAVNVGTAGAFVVNGGALGSPSSAGTLPAFTLGGTISGGGNQINNVVIGTSTPLAGSFTTVTASTSVTSPLHIGGTAAGSTLTLESTSGTGTSDALIFLTASQVERARIETGGKFNIGPNVAADALLTIMGNTAATVAPLATTYLHVVAADSANPRIIIDAFAGIPILQARRADGTLASKSAVASGVQVFNFSPQTWGGSTYSAIGSIVFLTTETQSETARGGKIVLSTVPNTLTTAITALTVDQDQSITVAGTTASTSKTTGSGKFGGGIGVAGATYTDTLNIITVANAATTAALCWNSGTGLVTENGAVGTCTVSLLAAKNLLRPLTNKEGFDIVMAMEPWRYTMKEGLPTWVAGEQIGFVADYADKIGIAKPVVARNHDGSLGGFRYEQYTAALTGAFKYHDAKIAAMAASNDNLRAEIEQLKQRIAR